MPTTTDPATVALYDGQVRAAWAGRALSDGTKLNLGRTDHEQMFAVTVTGTFPVVVTQEGWRRCDDGTQQRATKTNLGLIVPRAGGHTHPLGRNSDIIAEMPGEEDGIMARVTGKPAYVISRRRAFAVEEPSPNSFTIRVVAGPDFSRSERGRIQAIVATWNKHGGGGGARCEFTPD